MVILGTRIFSGCLAAFHSKTKQRNEENKETKGQKQELDEIENESPLLLFISSSSSPSPFFSLAFSLVYYQGNMK